MPSERYRDSRIFACFAEMLDYPHPGLLCAVGKGAEILEADRPQAAALLESFHEFLETTPASRVEEIYTATFDFAGTFHPYIGHHLLGDSYKRSALLVGLKERYRACGFAAGSELPDHLAVVLRFLAVCRDDKLAQELIGEALLPALNKMLRQPECDSEQAENDLALETGKDALEARSYRLVLQALKAALEPPPLDVHEPPPGTEPT